MAYLCYWRRGYNDAGYGRPMRLYQAGDIVNNNTDPNLYITATIDNVTYKFYNSAIYLNTSTNTFYPMFLTINGSTADHSYAVQINYSSIGWSDGSYGNCIYSNPFYIPSAGIRKRGGCIVTGDCIYYVLNNEITDAIVPVFTDYNEYLDYICSPIILTVASNGGGASYVSKVSGQLKDLSSNLSDILIVSGGGGGGMIIGTTVYDGKDAGGISGSGDNSADQSTGNAFGQGESGSGVSGGGSGLYGGYKGTSENSGGAGSGYIGNSSLASYTSQKKMVGYNVPTSSAGTTKTESVNTNDVNPEPNTPKINNGHIRIKYIREEVIPSYLSEVGTYLIGRPDNKQHLKTVPKWGNGNYDGSAESQWSWPMSLYHPNTNINSDSIALASFPDGATVNIDTTNGINVTYTGFTASRLFFRYGYWRARIGLSWEDPLASTPKGAYWCGYESGNDSQYEPTKNDFTSLDQLFEYIYNHFRHCNVVLNGTTIVSETSE